MQELTGRVAVVTGAASGIGRGLAVRFATEGMHVVLADVEAAALEQATELARERGGAATGRVLDVTDPAALDALAAEVDADLGGCAVLCNNAGVFAGGLCWERPPSDWDWVLGVNLQGILHGIRAFVPRMLARGTEGHIVNTVSAAGFVSAPFTGPYTVSKYAALGLTECLAHDLAATGAPIKVSALCPGAVATDIAGSERNRPAALAAAATPDAQFVARALADTTAAGLDPEQVAALVVDAIRAERFLVLTADRWGERLREHAEALLGGGLPPVPEFE